ncbi:MAG TPA: 8-amino-7-oxononanoate synthase [Steroidobacteraceae bacterium]|jgi:8-amino-7-oxononanoate synthase|nr:8-amino-7-oxononanoate synthase [Steroidobacteraceae bacterium]
MERPEPKAHLRRTRRVVESHPQPHDATQVIVEGRRLRNFCSNDYLGLSAHAALAQAATYCLQHEVFGAGASHLVTGHMREHHALEEELAAFTGCERALLFSSGYLANLGVIGALVGRGDRIVADRLCHASLLDGALLSGARLRRYAHGDGSAAARLLHAGGADSARRTLLITDGVFSMDGDVAPLAELCALTGQGQTLLLIDDAHGLGVLGELGRGSLEYCGLAPAAVPVLIGTLGKAFGSFGAFVAGDATLIEQVLQHARSYIYTTALPPSVAAATRAALRLIIAEPWRRERVQALTQHWRRAAAAQGLPLTDSPSPIQPLIVGDSARALALSEALMAEGFWVSAIRPPTVPVGTARLRVSLSAAHAESDLDALAVCLGRHWREFA